MISKHLTYCNAREKVWKSPPTFSLSESSADVASSSNSIFGFRSSARAIATRCFWPPESWPPLAPTYVSYFFSHKNRNVSYNYVNNWKSSFLQIPKTCKTYDVQMRAMQIIRWVESGRGKGETWPWPFSANRKSITENVYDQWLKLPTWNWPLTDA